MTGRSDWKHLVFAHIALLAIVAGLDGIGSRTATAGRFRAATSPTVGASRARRVAVRPARAARLRRPHGLDVHVRRPDARRLERQSGSLVGRQWCRSPRSRRRSGGSARRTSSGSGGEPADFELKLEVKLEGDIHSGIAYRSYVDGVRRRGRRRRRRAKWRRRRTGRRRPFPRIPSGRCTVRALDFDYDRKMAGNVEERGTPRREIAWRGGIVRAEPGVRPRLVGTDRRRRRA